MVIDGLAVAREARHVVEQLARAIGLEARLAEGRASLLAGGTAAAVRHEDENDVIADGKVLHAGAELHDLTGRLMAEHHGQRARAIAVDGRKVGVAEAGGADAHQDLVLARRVQVQRLDDERLGHGIGARLFHLVDDGGADFHGALPGRTVCLLPG